MLLEGTKNLERKFEVRLYQAPGRLRRASGFLLSTCLFHLSNGHFAGLMTLLLLCIPRIAMTLFTCREYQTISPVHRGV